MKMLAVRHFIYIKKHQKNFKKSVDKQGIV